MREEDYVDACLTRNIIHREQRGASTGTQLFINDIYYGVRPDISAMADWA